MKTTAKNSASLQDFFGGGGSTAERQARSVAQQRKRQERVVACMRKEGFTYVAFDSVVSFSGMDGPKEGEEAAWKRKNGYGMAKGMSMSFQPPTNQPVDPNQAIREKLSKADQRAYQKALYGFDPEKPPTDGGPMVPTGCMNTGFAEQSKVFETIGPKLESLSKRIDAHPRIAALDKKWSSCLRSKGFSAANDRELFEKVLMPAQTRVYESSRPSGSGGAPPVTAAIAGGGVPYFGGPDKAKIEEFRVFELKVANADVDCRSKNDEQTRKAVRAEYESAFVAANRAALDAVKEANG